MWQSFATGPSSAPPGERILAEWRVVQQLVIAVT